MGAGLETDRTSRSSGKERDTETGLDYFEARYYGSNMGRWLSPDWSASPMGVPYADFRDPQTLNLYGYVRNNPLAKADAEGHCEVVCVVVIVVAVEMGAWKSGDIYFGMKKASADAQYQQDTNKLFTDAARHANEPGYNQLDLNHLGQQATSSKVQTLQDAIKVGSDINDLAGKGNTTQGTGTGIEKAIGAGVEKGTGAVSNFLNKSMERPSGQNPASPKTTQNGQNSSPAATSEPPSPPPPPPPPPCALKKTGC